MYRVVCKLEELKRPLKALHKERFANIENDARLALTKLTGIQEAIYANPHNVVLHQQEEIARKEYEEANSARLSLLKQKLKHD